MPKRSKGLSAISQVEGNGFALTTLTCPKLMPSSGCATFSHPMGGGHLPLPRARSLFQPVDFDFLFERLEFRIAGHELGVFDFGERRAKAVGVGHLLGGFENGGL